MSKKGIALPVEMIVIIAICVLVMVVLAAFFVTGSGNQMSGIQLDSAFSDGCSRIITQYHCATDDATKNSIKTDLVVSGGKTFEKICYAKFPTCEKNGGIGCCIKNCGCVTG